ncbi:hypothetical protein B0A49_01300 [Cryomyces minteri]|uniref:Complex 1 LYR protein domain-containing protein n=1 Tax=Cryomyces minteri TaxID=331657 RepID=A0A4U0XPS7_9PEZI|nr:hypothetical protein B0A49_01300 [Cryomyces minteri]
MEESLLNAAACIALYRALLSQCSANSLDVKDQDGLKNIVRNRFKANRELHSTPKLKIAFSAGYEALDCLDASAAGGEASTSHLTSLLAQTQPSLLRAPKKPGAKPTPKTPAAHCNVNPSVLSRPHAPVSGRRRVPYLVDANAVPFLRFKKPQPADLARYIGDRIKQRQKRFDRLHALADDRILAGLEDQWDRTLLQEHGVFGVEEEPSWTKEIAEAEAVVADSLTKGRQGAMEWARRMQDVVDRETGLLESEKAERREVRRQEKIARAARRKSPESTTPQDMFQEALPLVKILDRYAVNGMARSIPADNPPLRSIYTGASS